MMLVLQIILLIVSVFILLEVVDDNSPHFRE